MYVLVIGASTNLQRISHQAIKLLRAHDYEVIALSNKVGEVAEVKFLEGHPDLTNVDTITLYVSPRILRGYIDYIISLRPRRVIFNPGTEDDDLMHAIAKHQIQVEEACTLVLLRTNQF